jgi:hypothetical protein
MAEDGYNANTENKRRELSREQEQLNRDVQKLNKGLENADVAEAASKFFGLANVVAGCAFLFFSGLTFFNMNTITVPDKTVAYATRVLGGENLPAGSSFARGELTSNPFGGMKGPQTEIITSGFHWEFMLNVLYDIDMADSWDDEEEYAEIAEIYKPYTVEPNTFSYVTTMDGVPMPEGEILAPKWANVSDFMNATKFLAADGSEGTDIGYKGDQLTLFVSSGSYSVNRKFFKFKTHKVDIIEKGEVGIVRALIQQASDAVCANHTTFTTPDGVQAALVPKDCRGVWEEPLLPNAYRLHPKAFKITRLPSMRDDVEFLGDYQQETIKFKTDEEGNIKAIVTPKNYNKPNKAESSAIVLRIGGWKIPNDFRLFFQIPPDQAPKAYVTLGDMDKIKKFLVGSSRSIFRTSAQGKDILSCDVYQEDIMEGKVVKFRKGDYKDAKCVADARKVSDLINGRDKIEEATLKALHDFAEGYGVNVISTLIGEPAIPSEYMIPRMRADYAKSLQTSYAQEKVAQEKRKDVEEARATANQQGTLVTARLENLAADEQVEKLNKLADAAAYKITAAGKGQRDADIARAEGQRKLVSVMGKDLIQDQVMHKMTLDAMVENPAIVKTADMVVMGGDGGANSALGTSTLALMSDKLRKERKATN